MSKLKVRVKRGRPESLTRQITNQLTDLINTGVLTAGEMLPSERTLADTLGVARNVVRRSYDYLVAGALVEGEGRRGKRVRSRTTARGGRAGGASAAKGRKTSGAKSTKKGSASRASKKSSGNSGAKRRR